jgi:hypothetical protein
MILPAWTNQQPDWQREVRRSFGSWKFQAGAGSYRTIPCLQLGRLQFSKRFGD